MAIVGIIEKITEWSQSEICDKVKLKLPDDNHTDKSYNENYKLVVPSSFSLYIPSKDRMPPKTVAPVPSLCVQMIKGKDELLKSKGSMDIRFCFSAWDTGIHGLDIFKPVKVGDTIIYEKWNTDEAKTYFKRVGDGWRDVWNFIDTALRVLESTDTVAGYRILNENGIEYGVFDEQGAIQDYYPYWYGWISFKIEYGIIRNAKYQDLL